MREHGIVVERAGNWRARTDSDHMFNIAPKPLDGDFIADRPNRKGAGDISHLRARGGRHVSGCHPPAFPARHRLVVRNRNDTAAVATFFMLKAVPIWRRSRETRRQTETAIVQ